MECPICFNEVHVMLQCNRCKKQSICEKCYFDKIAVDKTLTINCPLCRYISDESNGTFTLINNKPLVQQMNKKPIVNNYMNDDCEKKCMHNDCIVKNIANLPLPEACEMNDNTDVNEVCCHKFRIYMCVIGSCINCWTCVALCPHESVFNICRCLQFC